MNVAILVGRLTRDPELRYIPGSGTAVANCTVAVDRDYYKKDGSKDTDFIFVEAMGKTAEFLASYLSKGRLVSIKGTIRVDNYQDQSGDKKSFTKVSVKSIQALDSNKKNNSSTQTSEFEPVDDSDVPF